MRHCLERNRWAAALVAVLLLFATSGMAITRMTCLLSGHSVVSLGSAADCCPADEQASGPTVGAECCALSQARGGDDPYVGHGNAGLAGLFAVLQHAPFHVLEQAPVPAPARAESRPPPLLVPERLAVLGSFLI